MLKGEVGLKKMIIIIAAVLTAVILLVPVSMRYKDGGTVEYSAVLWGVTKYHSIAERNGQFGYETGTTVRILWFEVYNDFPRSFVSD